MRGESQYVDDAPPPAGMLHAAVFGSPKAHGIITRLATEAARAAPGVVAVLTADDIPGVNRFGPIFEDEQLLVEREVCFIGHPIALVVARSAHQARQARELIEVEIDELPVVVDPREAFAAGDLIHPPRTMAAGDVAGAWSGCDVVVEGPLRDRRPGAPLPGDAARPRGAAGGRRDAGVLLHPGAGRGTARGGFGAWHADAQGRSGREAARRRLRWQGGPGHPLGGHGRAGRRRACRRRWSWC